MIRETRYCHYCARPLVNSPKQDNGYTKDHTEPKCRGGKHVVPCCLRCNTTKSDGDYREFLLFAGIVLKGRRVPNREAAVMWKAWQLRALM